MQEVLGRRKHSRHRLSLPIQISWPDENADGEASSVGNSVDVSNYGTAVELPTSIPLSTPVKVRVDGVDVLSIGMVRNVREIPGGCFWVGLEFRRTLLGEAVPAIHTALLKSVVSLTHSPKQAISLRRNPLKRLINIRCVLMDHSFGWGRDADGNLSFRKEGRTRFARTDVQIVFRSGRQRGAFTSFLRWEGAGALRQARTRSAIEVS